MLRHQIHSLPLTDSLLLFFFSLFSLSLSLIRLEAIASSWEAISIRLSLSLSFLYLQNFGVLSVLPYHMRCLVSKDRCQLSKAHGTWKAAKLLISRAISAWQGPPRAIYLQIRVQSFPMTCFHDPNLFRSCDQKLLDILRIQSRGHSWFH